MNGQTALVPTFGPAEARKLTDEAKRDIAALRERLLLLYEGEAHLALGFSSWGEYWQTEFETSWRTGYRELEAARVNRAIDQLDNEAIDPLDNGRPLPEAQARELAPLLRQEDEDAVIDLWVELRDEYGEQLTAEKVRAAVDKKLKPKLAAVPQAPEADQLRASQADTLSGIRQGCGANCRLARREPRRRRRAGLPAGGAAWLAGAADADREGEDVSETLSPGGFCRGCRSHFCPHMAPHLYSEGERKRYLAEIRRAKNERLRARLERER